MYLYIAILTVIIGGILMLITTWYRVNNGKFITVRVLKWIIMVFEGLFSMPIFGHLMYILTFIVVAPLMLTLHATTFHLSKKINEPSYPHNIGMITVAVAFIPIAGWFSHMLTLNAIMYGADNYKETSNFKNPGMRGRGLIIPRKYKNAGKNLSTPQKTKDNEV